ncbi:MAG: S-type pyocin family protein [Brevundimonas sp.]|uniref:S-type pyocin family protein n=1 Tax=Brevundimonas sp. TaxID=1871086 RepID=UPI00255F624E|nr:S-type pyocin family protein [Brevundimonas sp.]MDK2746581.1 S-type pyocin family protein [Brevundimonas sp.]
MTSDKRQGAATGLRLMMFGLAVMALAGCDNASAVQTRDRTTAEATPLAVTASGTDGGDQVSTTPQAKPVLTASRRETVDDKIARLYQRNGADFGAGSAEDYLDKVTAFTAKPPRDAETVKRPNGDTLIYQASTNTFAVVARDGTPRTMFKPTTGADYWAEQKTAAPRFGQRRQSTPTAG